MTLRCHAKDGHGPELCLRGDRAHRPRAALSTTPTTDASADAGATTGRAIKSCCEAGGASDCPLVADTTVHVVLRKQVEVESLVGAVRVLVDDRPRLLSNLNVLVLPAVALVKLAARQEVRPGDVVEDGRKQAARNKIDGVVVVQVHRGPPNPAHICDEEGAETREAIAEEKRRQGRICSMKTWECAERYRCRCEAGGVHVDAKQLVNASQACR